MAHPQTNGQAETTNKVLLHGLQKKLDEAKGRRAEELHDILWSTHTIEKMATGETLFMLAYRSKIVLPVKVALHTHRHGMLQEKLNNAALREALDLLPTIRGDVLLRETLHKLRIAHLHPIKIVDFILRRTEDVAHTQAHGKLGRPIKGNKSSTTRHISSDDSRRHRHP